MKNLLLVFIVFIVSASYGVGIDSLIVECKITDKDTKAPVVAKVIYESQPFGSKIGIRTNSEVSFRVEYDEKYIVRIEAEGYERKSFTVDYHKYGGAGHIVEEIELVKGGGIGHVMILDALKFGQSSALITDEGKEELNRIASTMGSNISMIIQLEGHTDNQGNPKLLMTLSEERVRAARDYLITQGISKLRIKIKAFGGTKPLSKGTSAADRASNRRVELRVLEN